MKYEAKKYLLVIATQLLILYSASVFSVSTEVLDNDDVAIADANRLLEDVNTFNTIGMGIALSIAQCDGRDICDPTADENEIEQLIESLDKKIEGLVSRQQINEEDMSNFITAYVDTKERYADYMDRLSKISRPAELPQEDISEDDVFADEDALTEDEYSAFDDIDESLEDDEELEEFEDDSDPEDI